MVDHKGKIKIESVGNFILATCLNVQTNSRTGHHGSQDNASTERFSSKVPDFAWKYSVFGHVIKKVLTTLA